MNNTRFIRIVRIDSNYSAETAEHAVNHAVNEIREYGGKIVSIVPMAIPYFAYHIIYESETELNQKGISNTEAKSEKGGDENEKASGDGTGEHSVSSDKSEK